MVKEFAEQQYWAVILGGSSGLGLAAAQKLAEHGMNICILHQDTGAAMGKVNAAFEVLRANGVEVISFNVNITSREKQLQVLEQLKEKGIRIRCLLHSVAKGHLKEMKMLQQEDFMITLENMAVSLHTWVSLLLGHQLFAADARVLSFTSEGSYRALAHYGAVSAAKAALEAITRSMALEFAPYGIRSNCIQAGTTDTPSLRKIPGSDEIIAYSIQRNPFGRLTVAEDVANVVYLLCRDEAAWINGAVIPVDGGNHIR
jgi:enoyl-[acyl-carrier protein] reductase I